MLNATRLLAFALVLGAGLTGPSAQAEVLITAQEPAAAPLVAPVASLPTITYMMYLSQSDAPWGSFGGANPIAHSSLRSSQSNVGYLLGRTDQIRTGNTGFYAGIGSHPTIMLSR